jgi:hypothetical protein
MALGAAAPRVEVRIMSIQPMSGKSTDKRPSRLLLMLHILVTVGLFGADLVLVTLGFSAVLGADPRTIDPAAQRIASTVVAPLALISLVTGLVLARMSGWGLFRYWWVTLKLAITLVLTLVVFTVLVPRLSNVAATATDPTAASFAVAERLPLALAPALATIFLVLNVALAVYKPSWRVRRGRQHTSISEPRPAY